MPLTKSFKLFDSYLLEASAGTGKTFTIAHLFIRFLLEKVPLEKILVVTFTRAAAAELKERIRAQIKQVIDWLENGHDGLEYLDNFQGDAEALLGLKKSLAVFDSASIMTIHAFCGRMLKQAGIVIEQMELGSEAVQEKKMAHLVLDTLFFGLKKKGIKPFQLVRMKKRLDKIEKLSLRYLKERGSIDDSFIPFEDDNYLEALASLLKGVGPDEFKERYKKVATFYNKIFDKQGRLHPQFEKAFDTEHSLLESAEAFLHLTEDNRNQRKKSAPPEDLLITGTRDLLREVLKTAGDKQTLYAILSAIQATKKEAKHYFQSHDACLEAMHSALDMPSFTNDIQKSFDVVMVDEFQDTDPLQWAIFSRCFLGAKPLFLVGDPKQSIYSFRKADVYTYLDAADRVGKKILLSTNWRSTPALVDSFNHLFSNKPWLFLPKKDNFLEAPLLKAGKNEEGLKDGRGAIHLFLTEQALTKKEQEAQILEALLHELYHLSHYSWAILVNDRGQAKRVEQFLKSKGLVVANWQKLSQDDEGHDCGFRILLEALLDPHTMSRAALLLPLFGWSVDEVLSTAFEGARTEFVRLKEIWNTRGFAAAIYALLQSRAVAKPTSHVASLAEQLDQTLEGKKILFEVKHQTEDLAGLAWMRKPHLQDHLLSQFDNHMGEARSAEEGINILTTHASKGLEFDIVFAFGLGFESGAKEELFSINDTIKIVDGDDPDYRLYKKEIEAEKLRQLYVAMTRAKKRLYLPCNLKNRESPLTLFLERQAEGPVEAWLQDLSTKTSVTFSPLDERKEELCFQPVKKESLLEEASVPEKFSEKRILSFTALAKPQEKVFQELKADDMPAGAAVGDLLHKIFEEIPWGDFSLEKISAFVHPFLKNSSLEGHEDKVASLIFKALHKSLGGVKLADIPASCVMRELEFLHKVDDHYIKGFIDLAFEHEGQFFLVDWKSNRLSAYDQETMRLEMEASDYFLQAQIYKQAFSTFLRGKGVFKGVFYLFLRGLDDDGVFHVEC